MRNPTLTDAVLVKEYKNGDEAALSVLINRHQHRIYSFIYSKVFSKDIAEDIFQDTFIKVIRTLKKGAYSEEGKFLPWVMRIAHNLVIDHFRRNKRMPKFEHNGDFNIFTVLSDSGLNAENQLIREQIESDVQELIQQLPKDQLEVLVMRMYRDMSFKEIADKTGVSINTALGRMRYALINLRKVIQERQLVLTD